MYFYQVDNTYVKVFDCKCNVTCESFYLMEWCMSENVGMYEGKCIRIKDYNYLKLDV